MRAEQNELLTRTAAGTPMGELFRRYWLPALLASELPAADCAAGARQAAVGTTDRLPRQREPPRPDRRILRAPRRRRSGSAATRKAACAARITAGSTTSTGQCVEIPSEPDNPKLCRRMKLKSYPLRRARRRALDLHGAARAAAAAAGARVGDGPGRPALRLEALAGVQLPAGDGGRHRLEPCLVPAPSHDHGRSAVQGMRRATSTTCRTCGRTSRWSSRPAGSTSARAATRATASTTGASRNG